jgi:hypothetical protein
MVRFFPNQRRWIHTSQTGHLVAAWRSRLDKRLRAQMKLFARGTLASSWFGMLLALLTVGALLPEEARAGCTAHYLTGRSTVAPALQLDSLITSGALATSPNGMPLPRPAPCTGALCSGYPAQPFSTVPSLPAGSAGQWALPSLLVSQNHSDSFQRLPSNPDLSPVHQSSSIFHPPRSLA